MRTIKVGHQFKRDYRRAKAGQAGQKVAARLAETVEALAADKALPVHNRDHALSGQWRDHRDCHVRPDLVLIYRKPDEETLELIRLGSHSELGW